MRYALQPTRYLNATRERQMYERSAHLYDLVYGQMDYAHDAAALRAAIIRRTPGARTLLDVACGTGSHLVHLREHFAVEGLDLDPRMVAMARFKVRGVPIHHGDMRSFALTRRFDAVVCLFSAIGAMRTVDELRITIANFARHRTPNGVVVVEPWILPAEWEDGRLRADVVTYDDAKVAVLGVSHRRGTVAVIDMHVAVARARGLEHRDERFELGLFSDAEYRAAFSAAGLAVERIDGGLAGRGWYVGTTPAAAGAAAGVTDLEKRTRS